jgi:general stress protein CsbA
VYVFPLLVVAFVLVGLKAQNQAIVLMLAAAYVTDDQTFYMVIMLAVFSMLFGRFRSAAES